MPEMEGRAPVSVAAGASGDAPLVSPPILDERESSPPSSFAAPSQTSQTAATTAMTPNNGSPVHAEQTPATQPIAQHTAQDPSTPETSSGRSGSEGVPTPTESEKGGEAARHSSSSGQSGQVQATNGESDGLNGVEAGQETGKNEVSTQRTGDAAKKNTKKQWFEVISMVLQNYRKQDREQIRQLATPQCEICERRKATKKAEVRCQQEGCVLGNRPLCMDCWRASHWSTERKEHRRIQASSCQQCQIDHVAYWCAECDLKFCQGCFNRIHTVGKTKLHRRLATEDAPGTCLVKSDWSRPFQNAIMQLVAQRKRPRPTLGSNEDVIGEKRKRDVEVIVIDDDDDHDMDGGRVHDLQPVSNGSLEPMAATGEATVTQNGTETQNVGVGIALTRPNQAFAQLQGPPWSAPATSQASGPHNSMVEPIPFPPELSEAASASTPSSSARFEAVHTNSGYNVPIMPNVSNEVNVTAGVSSMQWDTSVSQFSASSASMGTLDGSSGFTAATMCSGMMAVSPTSMPASMSTASGVWSTTSAISTDLASISNPNNLPLGGAVFAENALVDSLVDRYHEVNQSVTNFELQTEQLTRHIAVATCKGPYAAGPLMTKLSALQPVLESERKRRDKLFVAMIIQSHDIMAAVRLLRLTELGDVPQVPMISHRKCLQISNEINHHKKKLIELNQTLSETLTQSHEVSSSWETTLIRSTSATIKSHEKCIQKLKKDREVEIVRIVQFSRYIRDTLKQTFQRSVEIRRQQQQQEQQFQQYG